MILYTSTRNDNRSILSQYDEVITPTLNPYANEFFSINKKSPNRTRNTIKLNHLANDFFLFCNKTQRITDRSSTFFTLLNPLATSFAPSLSNLSTKEDNKLNPLAKCFTPKSIQILNIPLTPFSDYINDLDTTAHVCDVSTPEISFSDSIANDTCAYETNLQQIPLKGELGANTRSVESREINSDNDSPHSILQGLRIKNTDKIIIGHLNINSIRNKIHLLADMITNRVDIMLISETKLDNTFPKSQFFLHGYSEPHRLDRTSKGAVFFFTYAVIYLQNVCP